MYQSCQGEQSSWPIVRECNKYHDTNWNEMTLNDIHSIYYKISTSANHHFYLQDKINLSLTWPGVISCRVDRYQILPRFQVLPNYCPKIECQEHKIPS